MSEPFEFDLDNPGSWRNFNAPYLESSIPADLLRIGGVNHRGKPRLRAVWGGEVQFFYEGDQDTPEGWYLKYHLCWVSYRGHKEEIGKPRWIIEEWHEAGDCQGLYPSEGYYHLLTVQRYPIDRFTGMGAYREIGADVLKVIKGMIHINENTTEGERESMRATDDAAALQQKQKAQAE